MKIVIEGKDNQISAIVLMLQGFGVSITDEAGNSLINKKLTVNYNQDTIAQAEEVTKEINGINEPEETAESTIVEEAETQQADEEELSEETAEVKNKKKKK